MIMLFALIIGVLLGFSGFKTPLAILILAVSLAAKVAVDVRWRRVPLVGSVSPYVVYCHNLARAGEPIGHARLSYTMQVFLFGGLLGGAAYALVRTFV
jgi:hypothetical protein